MDLGRSAKTMLNSFNRTMKELKLMYQIAQLLTRHPFNRTMKELKWLYFIAMVLFAFSFNRTMKELK